MDFFEGVGSFFGGLAGVVIGGAVSIVGEITDSDFIKEIGEGVCTACENSGILIGQAADGAVGIVGGVITSDELAIEEGFEKLGDATKQTVCGIGQGISNVAKNGGDLVSGILDGNEDEILNASKNLVKTAAISVLAIGVADYIGIIGDDGIGADGMDVAEDINDTVDVTHVADISESSDIAFDADIDDISDNQEFHNVDPHYVEGYTRADGTEVSGYYRDGDGNPNTTLTAEQGGGYLRSNPSKM